MAAAIWKGHITFGLISIPIRLHAAARKETISLHQIHKTCHTRIRQPLFCPTDNRIVNRSEIIKGYEYEKDQYVFVEPEEVKAIAPPSERTMEIQEFVKVSEVDPIYFNDSYLAIPEPPGRKAYELLRVTLEESGRAALAKVAMHQREYLVILRPRQHGLTLHTMYYADEIRSVPEYGQGDHVQPKTQEVKLAKQLVESLSAPFKPEKYHDEYQERLKALLESKQQGQEVIATAPSKPLAPVVDMMDALKRSLAAREEAARKQPRSASAITRGAAAGSKRTRKKAS